MKNAMKFLTLCVLVGVVVGMCGCTSPQVSNPLAPPTNRALDYGNALVKETKDNLKANQTITSSKVVENGSNGARASITIEDASKSGFWNGTTTTESVSITAYGSTIDAKKAFDDASFGFTPGKPSDIANMTKPGNDTYKVAFGHSATVNNQAVKLNNLSFVSMSASLVAQQDEIVWVASVSMMPK
jgi:hypothetical protein